MSYSNPMHHDAAARAPVRPVDLLPLTPATAGLLRQRDILTRQVDELERERDELLRLIGRIHNSAAESPEWIRARIDETIVRLAAARAQ
jgi:hypothetical protein